MDGFELLAVVVFFLNGYWLVDFFWPKRKTGDNSLNPQDREPPGPANPA